MSTTLSQLRTKVRNEMKTDPNGRIWGDTVLNDYINSAYLQVQSDGNFRWPGNDNGSASFSTTSGTTEYALASDFGWMELMLRSNTQLYEMDFVELKLRNPNSTTGTPSNYYIRGSNIGLDPVPNSSDTITYYYRKILATLSSDSSEIGLNDNFAPAIVKYAAYLAWSAPRGNADEAEKKYQDYKRELTRLKSAYLMRDTANLNFLTQRGGRFVYYPDRLNYD